MSALQILGHIFTLAKSFVGAERELTADTSNWDLRLHDASTPGGHVFLNRDNADERYQARSTELDGLLGFEPQDNGFLVRLGPANYRLRIMTVDSDSISLSNEDGYSGNPLFALAPIIASAHTFEAQITFETQIIGSGGFLGDVTGNVTGNLTGNVTGNVTGNLTGNAVGNHSGSFTGDLNTVGETVTLDSGQILLDYLNQDALDYIATRGLPPGTIVLWSGAINEIPDGWALCDGGNDTPDLTERFVVGAKSLGTFVVDANGGSSTHTHAITVAEGGAHAHSGTVGATALTIAQLPAHYHANGVVDAQTKLFNHGTIAADPTMNDSIDGNSANGTIEGLTSTVGSGETHTHTLSTEESGAHSHTGTADAFSTLPPYYALAYIMKLAYA